MDTEIVQVTATSLEASTRAEVDIQIATARKFPRDVARCLSNAQALATSSPQVAAACHYAVPRGGKSIEGPSIRMAEIVAYAWGNLRCAARVIEVSQTEVVCQGLVHDLERNVAVSKEVRRPIVYSSKGERSGQRYTDDQINVTANAGCSIALRNAIFAALPRALWDGVYQGALEIIRQADPVRRQKALAWFAGKGASQESILRVLGVRRPEDIGPDEMEKLVGWRNALDEGATTIHDIIGAEPQEPKPAPRESAPTARTERRRMGTPVRQPEIVPTTEREPGMEDEDQANFEKAAKGEVQ